MEKSTTGPLIKEYHWTTDHKKEGEKEGGREEREQLQYIPYFEIFLVSNDAESKEVEHGC